MGDVVFSQQLFSSVKSQVEMTKFMNREEVKDAIKCGQLPFDMNFNDTKIVAGNIIEKRNLGVNDFDKNLWNMLFRVEQFTCKRASIDNEGVLFFDEADNIRDKVMPTELMQCLMNNGFINISQIEIYAKKYQVKDDGQLHYLFRQTDFKKTNIPEKPNSGIFCITRNEVCLTVFFLFILSALHISPYTIF